MLGLALSASTGAGMPRRAFISQVADRLHRVRAHVVQHTSRLVGVAPRRDPPAHTLLEAH